MAKNHINLTVDPEVLASIRSSNINVSATVNELLRDFLNVKEFTGDELAIQQEMDTLRQSIESAQKRMAILSAKKVAAMENRSRQEREKEEREQAAYIAFKTANPLRYM